MTYLNPSLFLTLLRVIAIESETKHTHSKNELNMEEVKGIKGLKNEAHLWHINRYFMLGTRKRRERKG